MKRFELYVWLTTFFRPPGAQSELRLSGRLWLLPWHVPPIAKSALWFEGGIKRRSESSANRHLAVSPTNF
jgi:hypothetical protein